MQKILVLDFGGQYNQLIARRVREQNIYAEIKPYNKITVDQIKAEGYSGIIFLDAGIPLLGICYGCQLMAYMAGGIVEGAEDSSEYGKIEVYARENVLFTDVPSKSVCWMSHHDYIPHPPKGFTTIAITDKCPTAAMCDESRRLYGVQFHPEVTHTEYGKQILHNFLYQICGCKGDWQMDSFIEDTVNELRDTIGDKGVVLGLSGGVDSSVAAALLSKAVGKQLTCVFVDQGLMRKDEGDFVENTFTKLFDMNFVRINCQDEFLSKLKGLTDPEDKRTVIGTEFYNVFWNKIRESYGSGFFAQGTIYPDPIRRCDRTAQGSVQGRGARSGGEARTAA